MDNEDTWRQQQELEEQQQWLEQQEAERAAREFRQVLDEIEPLLEN